MKSATATTKKKAILRDHSGAYVFGFSAQRQCVQITATRSAAKVFASVAAAQRFIDTYADAGYGLMRTTTEILTVG
jgi:hypothetical protein